MDFVFVQGVFLEKANHIIIECAKNEPLMYTNCKDWAKLGYTLKQGLAVKEAYFRTVIVPKLRKANIQMTCDAAKTRWKSLRKGYVKYRRFGGDYYLRDIMNFMYNEVEIRPTHQLLAARRGLHSQGGQSTDNVSTSESDLDDLDITEVEDESMLDRDHPMFKPPPKWSSDEDSNDVHKSCQNLDAELMKVTDMNEKLTGTEDEDWMNAEVLLADVQNDFESIPDKEKVFLMFEIFQKACSYMSAD